MSLEGLNKLVSRIRSVHEQHGPYIGEQETRTRAILVDPILRELGWDVTDPSRVQLELRVNGNVIDYVLCREGKYCGVLEAKPSKAALDVHRKQATGYAVEIGVAYALVTNGLRWEAWKVVPETPRKESVIAEVNLTTGDVEDISKSLYRLSFDLLGS